MVEASFTNPDYLWVLLLIPFVIIIHFLTLKQSKSNILKFSNFEAIERVTGGSVLGTPYRGMLKNKNIGILILRALTYSLLVLSVAGTNIFYKGEVSVFDYVLAIDASSSMLAEDFFPNRFEAAKINIGKFVDILHPKTKISIVTFSTSSIVDLKNSQDIQETKDLISSLDLHQSGGTAIGDAIVTSVNLFESNKSKAIVLITDGQNNVGIDTETAIEYANKNGVVIHTIGMATKEGGKLPGLEVVSRIDQELLKRISEKTEGRFFVVENTESLLDAFNKIASRTEKVVSKDISWILLIGAITLLGLEWTLINTIYKTIP